MTVTEELAKAILQKNRRAIARGITVVENGMDGKTELMERIFAHTGSAYIVGLTGSPGAGKSSLVDRLLTLLRSENLSVAVVAVDPTSPFTGGALLGDRVRMSTHYTDPEIFIRSMGTRGSLGGLARACKEAVRILDAAGYDIILVETVGVGQSELDIMHIADTTLVVLNPGAGDMIQAFKAGIMEIADGFVINKADLSGTDKLATEIEAMLDLAKHNAAWRPPIVKTISRDSKGIKELWEMVLSHKSYLKQSQEGDRRRQAQLEKEVMEIAIDRLSKAVENLFIKDKVQTDMQEVLNQKLSPYVVADKLVADVAREVVTDGRNEAGITNDSVSRQGPEAH